MGTFLAVVEMYPRLDIVAEAVFVSVFKELSLESQYKVTNNELKVQDDLLYAVESLFCQLRPILISSSESWKSKYVSKIFPEKFARVKVSMTERNMGV